MDNSSVPHVPIRRQDVANACGAIRYLEISGTHFVLLQPPDFLRPIPGVPYSTTFPSAFEVMLQVEITRPDGTADPLQHRPFGIIPPSIGMAVLDIDLPAEYEGPKALGPYPPWDRMDALFKDFPPAAIVPSRSRERYHSWYHDPAPLDDDGGPVRRTRKWQSHGLKGEVIGAGNMAHVFDVVSLVQQLRTTKGLRPFAPLARELLAKNGVDYCYPGEHLARRNIRVAAANTVTPSWEKGLEGEYAPRNPSQETADPPPPGTSTVVETHPEGRLSDREWRRRVVPDNFLIPKHDNGNRHLGMVKDVGRVLAMPQYLHRNDGYGLLEQFFLEVNATYPEPMPSRDVVRMVQDVKQKHELDPERQQVLFRLRESIRGTVSGMMRRWTARGPAGALRLDSIEGRRRGMSVTALAKKHRVSRATAYRYAAGGVRSRENAEDRDSVRELAAKGLSPERVVSIVKNKSKAVLSRVGRRLSVHVHIPTVGQIMNWLGVPTPDAPRRQQRLAPASSQRPAAVAPRLFPSGIPP